MGGSVLHERWSEDAGIVFFSKLDWSFYIASIIKIYSSKVRALTHAMTFFLRIVFIFIPSPPTCGLSTSPKYVQSESVLSVCLRCYKDVHTKNLYSCTMIVLYDSFPADCFPLTHLHCFTTKVDNHLSFLGSFKQFSRTFFYLAFFASSTAMLCRTLYGIKSENNKYW